jgi:alpha-L-arabinofuranosidase
MNIWWKTKNVRAARLMLLLAAMSTSIAGCNDSSVKKKLASVVIHTAAPLQKYDPMIFGGFLEHFDNQIYGGIFEPGSPLADENGFRTDVIDALRELKVPVVRWPGGCFVDAYHWQGGVGSQRKPYGDPRWGVIESNTFGTHEFIEFCRKIGAEPYVCQNGLAGEEEMAAWVEYCNAVEGTYADMRRANGHNEPFNVRFWSVGNERYDTAYIHKVRNSAIAMKQVDPGILVTCAGSQGGMQGLGFRVSSYLFETAGEYLDYISVHNYWLDRGDVLPRYGYLQAIARSDDPEAYISLIIESIEEAGLRGKLKIAFDEWNLRAWQHPGFPRDEVDDFNEPEILSLVDLRKQQNDLPDQYTMADALFAASFFNACIRHSEDVTMANIAPLVNTRGPLFVHPGGIVKRSHFHTMSMYANRLESHFCPSGVTSGILVHGKDTVAMVDALATVDETGKSWAISLVNRDPSEDVGCTVKIGERLLNGKYRATVLTGSSPDDFNDIHSPDRVSPQDTEVLFRKGVVTLPPHSLTIVFVQAD